MNRTFAIAILVLTLTAQFAHAQRCGDKLWLSLDDPNSRPIPPSAYKAVKVTIDYNDPTEDSKRKIQEVSPEQIHLSDKTEALSIRTLCGLSEARFELSFDNEQMVILIQHIPGDAGNFVLRNFPFQPGTFQIDLGNRSLQNVDLVHNTILDGSRIVEERLWSLQNSKIQRIAPR